MVGMIGYKEGVAPVLLADRSVNLKAESISAIESCRFDDAGPREVVS
jgi:hypothetical protein